MRGLFFVCHIQGAESVTPISLQTEFLLANAGHDTRSLASYFGHRNIQDTVRFTELAPENRTSGTS